MENLPSEVLTHILQYISVKDRLQMSLVNRTWYQSALHPKLIKNDVFLYNETILLQPLCVPAKRDLQLKFNEFARILSNSKRSIVNLKYVEIKLDCNNYLPLIENLADQIVSLSLVSVPLFSDAFLDTITQFCNNLQTLEFKNVNISILTVKCRKPLLKLNSITFNDVDINDRELNQILQCAPYLKDIGFYSCDVLQWPQAIKRFYTNYRDPEIVTNYNSEYVLTNKNIINYLKRSKTINSLRLDNNYSIFLELPKHIKLKTLIFDTWTFYPDVPIDDNFISKLGTHASLERLELINFPCCLLPAVSKMYDLKYLKLIYTIEISSYNSDNRNFKIFLKTMSNLKHLREFTIVPCANFKQVTGNKKQIPNNTLKSLKLLKCSIGNCWNILHFGGNLTTLQILNCNFMTFNDYQLLFNNLTNLMHLKICDCMNLDDKAFLDLNIFNIKGLVTLDISDADLTYRCLKGIKLFNLKVLSITKISIGECGCTTLSDEDLSNLKRVLIEFAYYVPSLTSLRLSLKTSYIFNIGPNGIHVDLLTPYCTKLKNIVIK